MASNTAAAAATTTVSPTATEAPGQSQTIPIVLASVIGGCAILAIIIYIIYRYRHKLCGGRKPGTGITKQSEPLDDRSPTDPDQVDLIQPSSVSEVHAAPILISNGLQSGRRDKPTRLQAPKKWYDSAAITYMDQSLEDLTAV